ncbi:MAG: phosphatidate cytidylyltransferase [Paracoccaceae bacterium]
MSDTGQSPGKWDDLNTRIASGVVMVLVGAAAIWAGGLWFLVLAAAVAGGMAWELARMTADPDALPGPSVAIGLGAAAAVLAAGGLAHPFWQVALAGPSLALALTERRDRVLAALYALGLMVAVWGLVGLRSGGGVAAVLWLVLLVVASDMMGYFAGRRLGGPKFWPAISPKKTWSGTVAGWLGAAVVGAVFWLAGFGGVGLVVVSVLIAFAGQMGDICESWIKRRAGVKDASNLIPGHGGLMDRFDALTAAALVIVLLSALGLMPLQVW